MNLNSELKNKTVMISQERIKEVLLIDDQFSPSEAHDLIASLIESNINFYKLQHLKEWEKDHSTGMDPNKQKITRLQMQKENLKDLIKLAKETDCNLKIEGTVKIHLTL